jgi:hypothetical protein
VWTATLPVVRNGSSPGMSSNNASQWLYPVQWSPLLSDVAVDATSDRVATSPDAPGGIFAIVHGDAHGGAAAGVVSYLTCDGGGACKCVGNATAPFAFGVVNDVAVVDAAAVARGTTSLTAQEHRDGPRSDTSAGTCLELWIACDAGLVHVSCPQPAGAAASFAALDSGVTFTLLLNGSDAASTGGVGVVAVAASTSTSLVAAGNSYRLWLFEAAEPVADPWWEWVTDMPTQSGSHLFACSLVRLFVVIPAVASSSRSRARHSLVGIEVGVSSNHCARLSVCACLQGVPSTMPSRRWRSTTTPACCTSARRLS